MTEKVEASAAGESTAVAPVITSMTMFQSMAGTAGSASGDAAVVSYDSGQEGQKPRRRDCCLQ